MDKDYWRLKKREQRAKKKEEPVTVGSGESVKAEVAKTERPVRPDFIPEAEWVLACERAERARRYAGKFPQFVKRGEVVYQDAMWQWENEVRGRFGGVVGGSLSGTRGERI